MNEFLWILHCDCIKRELISINYALFNLVIAINKSVCILPMRSSVEAPEPEPDIFIGAAETDGVMPGYNATTSRHTRHGSGWI